MPGRKARVGRRLRGYLANRVALTIVLVLLVLAGLPVAVWLDLRNLSERALREQADESTAFGTIIPATWSGACSLATTRRM